MDIEAIIEKVLAELSIPNVPFFDNGIDVACFEYISPRERELTVKEEKIRDIAYGLKLGKSNAVRYAASCIAKFLPVGSILIPIPSSSGDTSANLILAKEIAKYKKVQIVDLLKRSNKVTPSHELRKQGKEIPNDHHQFSIDDKSALVGKKVYMIDNVITSGATMNAGRKAIGGFAKGIAFAKAKDK